MESYIVQNTAVQRYIAGQTAKQSPNFNDNVEMVAQQINEGTLVTILDARTALDQLAS